MRRAIAHTRNRFGEPSVEANTQRLDTQISSSCVSVPFRGVGPVTAGGRSRVKPSELGSESHFKKSSADAKRNVMGMGCIRGASRAETRWFWKPITQLHGIFQCRHGEMKNAVCIERASRGAGDSSQGG